MKAIILLALMAVAAVPPLPTAVPPPPTVVSTNRIRITNYFAVTALADNGLESDYSKELMTTNAYDQVTVMWDKNTESNVIAYRVYYGTNSRAYSRSVKVVGTNSATLILRTNIWDLMLEGVASLRTGNWITVSNVPTILSVTNPTGEHYYRLGWRKRK